MVDFPERLAEIIVASAGDDYNPLASFKLMDMGYRMIGVLYNNLGNSFYDRYEQTSAVERIGMLSEKA